MISVRVNLIKKQVLSFVLILALLVSFPIAMGEDTSTIINRQLDVTLGTIHQLEVTIGEPVVMYQELKVKNLFNETLNGTLRLSDYPDLIPEVYLDEYLLLTISSDGQVHSAQPVLPVILAPYDSKEYILEYQFTPVYKDFSCIETTIADHIPIDAQVLPSTLPPETLIEKKCSVKIHHEGDIHYYNVEVTLEELEGEKINSIYYVEGETYLTMENGVISLIQ